MQIDPAQALATVGEELEMIYVDHDLPARECEPITTSCSSRLSRVGSNLVGRVLSGRH